MIGQSIVIRNAKLARSYGTKSHVHLGITDGVIKEISDDRIYGGNLELDAMGALVLPGIVDVHCEALETNMAPRGCRLWSPMSAEAVAIRECLSWGITSPIFTVTASLEPGSRSIESCISTLEGLKESVVQLRIELLAQEYVPDFLRGSKAIQAVCINNHAANALSQWDLDKYLRYIRRRSRLTADDEVQLIQASKKPLEEWYSRIEQIATDWSCPIGYHDLVGRELVDFCVQNNISYGEWVMDEDTAAYAAARGMKIVLGAANVVRGASHNQQIDATRAIERGWCNVLCSDYSLPSIFYAPFEVEKMTGMPFAECWDCVSTNPAQLLKLEGRDGIRTGNIADLLIVEPCHHPKILAVIKQGRLKILEEPALLTGVRSSDAAVKDLKAS